MSALVLNRTIMMYNRNTGTYSPAVSKNKAVISLGNAKKCNFTRTLITPTLGVSANVKRNVLARSSLWDTNILCNNRKLLEMVSWLMCLYTVL